MSSANGRTISTVIATLLLTPALLTGCGGGGYGSSSTTAAATTTGAGGTAGHRVTATESEYKIALSATSVPAGTYSLAAVNQGKIDHALAIDGPGVSNKQTSTISPGSSQTLAVTLQKGTYDIFCPLPGHKALGMDAKLTVT